MVRIDVNTPGRECLLLGNEAIARGALEAGVGFVSGYPGTPSSEVIPTIAQVAKRNRIHVEWAANEKVALEAVIGASLAGIRSMAVMKQNGLNVALDFLAVMNQTGINAGAVLLVADDPGPLSSNNEEDTRVVAKWIGFPLLEPCCAQEAKEMTRWAFDVSQHSGLVCMVRTTNRIGHTRAKVTLGEIPSAAGKAYFGDINNIYEPTRGKHLTVGGPLSFQPIRISRFQKAKEILANLQGTFNWYIGPENPKLLIVTSGVSYFYSKEALRLLGLEKEAGLLKLGTLWPMPEELVERHILVAKEVLFVEESEPFLEDNVLGQIARLSKEHHDIAFYGKRSGHVRPYGDNSVELVVDVLLRITGGYYEPRPKEYGFRIEKLAREAPARSWEFCPGCPYRPFFWAMNTALRLDGRNGFATGDVGCYQLGGFNAGYYQVRTQYAMGSGPGIACGFGNLTEHGFDQPVLSLIGDSTFFHAGFPALASSIWNKANFTFIVMDNSTTAMTGHQPHPGSPVTAMGDPTRPLNIEDICRAMGCRVEVIDPFDIKGTIDILLDLISTDGVKVLIVRRECELLRAKRENKAPFKMHVEAAKCVGEECGCVRLCTRLFHCPGLIWDKQAKKARIDDAICTGCGVCADVCQQGAIIRSAD